MSQTVTGPHKTFDDYMQLPDCVRAELIDGQFYALPLPNDRHQRIVSTFAAALQSFVNCRSLGGVYTAPLKVHLPAGNIVRPDLIFVRKEHEGIVQEFISGVPDLLVEVVSPETSQRDRLVKRDLYARSGVCEYWLVDDLGKSIELLRLAGHRYSPVGSFIPPDVMHSELLADWEVAVGQILA